MPVLFGGICIGEGMAPVLERLAARIRRGKFVEMCELIPGVLLSQGGGWHSKSRETMPTKTSDSHTHLGAVFCYLCECKGDP